jgi:hypothetical protein
MSILDDFSEAIGTNKSSGALAQATGNVLAPGGTIAPWAGNLNPLNPDALVGQMTRDVGALNPFNPDSTAGKVVNNIGADMAKDPAKWVAIAACIASGPAGWRMIPYVNAVAKLTSKNSSPEDWLKEGAKAYVIQAGGDYISGQVAGTGPQTDITTGEAYAGTGASGATGSAAAGSVAGNISRNIFGAAARKGSTDVNSAAIITNALSNEGLKEAFAQIPGFSDLSKDEQSAGINAFKVAFNKDSNAATMLLNQGFQATYKELNNKALWTGYNDLNQQNTVTNYVMSGGSKEDVAAFADQETKLTAAYNDYRIYTAKGEAYDELWNQYNAATTWGAKNKIAAQMRTAWADLQSPETIAGSTAAYNKYADTWRATDSARTEAITAFNEGWDSITQKNEATAAGFTTPEAYDTYLTDKKAAEEPTPDPNPEPDPCAEGWHWDGSMCVPDDDKPPEKPEDCQEGYVYDFAEQKCVPVDSTPPEGPEDCAEGWHWDGSKCVLDDESPEGCAEGWHWDGSKCVLDEEFDVCPEGYLFNMETQTCEPIDACPEGYVLNLGSGACEPVDDPTLPWRNKVPSIAPTNPSKKPTTPTTPTTPTVPKEPDVVGAVLAQQQQTPVTYQTVTPELAKVFYGGRDFSSTPQKMDAQGQLVQSNPLLEEPKYVDPAKPLNQVFNSTPQKTDEQGQLVQSNPLLHGPDLLDLTKPQPASALAPQGNTKENDVAAMLAKILGGEGGSTSQEELLKILGKG